MAFGLIAGVQLSLLGPVMHESDQASLLSGAWKLAHGEANPFQAGFYNYDKTYFTYLYLAAWLGVFPKLDPVLVGNVAICTVFWAAVAGLLARRPPQTWPQAIGLIAVLLAPALWQHSAFLAANPLAAACMIGGVLAWSPASRLRRIAGLGCFAAAVAARADSLPLLPLIAWLVLPRRPFFRWVQNPWLWGIALAGVLATAVGWGIGHDVIMSHFDFFFNAKVYAAYVAFGLGGAAFALAGWVAGWFGIALFRNAFWQKFYYLLGAAGLLPLFAFYSFQLHSTRYWIPFLAALAVGLTDRRITALTRRRLGWPAALGLAFLAAAALGPVAVGLQLPFVNQPALRLGPGTVFPSADGDLTMGGYLPRAWQLRQTHFAADYNQPLWESIRQTRFETDDQSRVPFLDTPLFPYYELAATLAHQRAQKVPATAALFYVDSRSLLRRNPNIATGLVMDPADLLENRKILPASEPAQGYRMLKITAGSPTGEMQTLAALRRIFSGNEFRLLPDGRAAVSPEWRGHTTVLYSEKPFEIRAGGLSLSSNPEKGGIYFLKFPGRNPLNPAIVSPEHLAGLKAAASVLPDYMAIEKL